MPLKASVVSDSADAPSWPSRKQAQRVKTLQAQAGLCVKTVQAWCGVDSTDKVCSHRYVEPRVVYLVTQNVV